VSQYESTCKSSTFSKYLNSKRKTQQLSSTGEATEKLTEGHCETVVVQQLYLKNQRNHRGLTIVSADNVIICVASMSSVIKQVNYIETAVDNQLVK
jgi:hypothetical protein